MIRFTVAGIPKPQGSKRAFVVNGRAVLTESAGVALKDWRSIVAHEAARATAGAEPLDGPLAVGLLFWLPAPKRLPKGREMPAVRPDLDKLVRATLDAMTGIVFRDDAQIVELVARKGYGTPGVTVRIGPYEPAVVVGG